MSELPFGSHCCSFVIDVVVQYNPEKNAIQAFKNHQQHFFEILFEWNIKEKKSNAIMCVFLAFVLMIIYCTIFPSLSLLCVMVENHNKLWDSFHCGCLLASYSKKSTLSFSWIFIYSIRYIILQDIFEFAEQGSIYVLMTDLFFSDPTW